MKLSTRNAVPAERGKGTSDWLGRTTFRTLNGHLVCPTLPVNGWWMVETEPGSQVFNFGTTPDAMAVMREHNWLWAAKHGDDAVAEEVAKHALWVERVRQINRERGFTDAEIDAEFEAARRRYAGESDEPVQAVIF